MTITLYDIPSSAPGGTWSPHVWKVLQVLNYKCVSYKTEWIEMCDIELHCQSLGIEPTIKRADGSVIYTLPAIYDNVTGVYVADSLPIAEYLETRYPTPSIFPGGTKGLQFAFEEALLKHTASVWQFVIGVAIDILPEPRTKEFYRRTREKSWGKHLEAMAPPKVSEEREKEWGKAREAWSKVAKWYGQEQGGPFMLGETVSWTDFVVSGHLFWYRAVWGEESAEWQDVMTWDDGHWKTFCDAMKPHSETR
ncbi:hypothetical protein D9619_013138 [Psilocybe cf. subviscida]|uniref:GST N-terminal domain-containing protein n=1 Tax=Psilocybe cf. subviscida TaxID=2480587 RepID=A0A8H5EZ10_9AGAR|nr:hypothetical protein D9619_013138 [Psilocybe cf. subviscida]